MKALALKWLIQEVPLKQINIPKSLENNARAKEDRLDKEVASDFALAMAAGDIFPRVVLLERGKEKIILGGNHRIAAIEELHAETLEAYLISTDDEKALGLLPRILNRGHGIPQERKEAIGHAIYAMKEFGIDVEEAAALFSIARTTIQQTSRAQELRVELKKAAINDAVITDSTLLKLSPIKNEIVRNSAARLLVEYSVSGEMAKTFLEEVGQEKRSEANQMAVIAKWQNAVPKRTEGEPAKSNRKLPIRTRFLIALGSLEKLLRGKCSLANLQITTTHEQATVRPRTAKVGKAMSSLAKI